VTGPATLLAVLGAPAAAPGPRPRRCWRCEMLVAHAEKAALPAPPVHEVESWVSLSRRYYTALCRECADWEWSANWNARHAAAADNPPERQALDRQRQDHLARGRRFCPDARLLARPDERPKE
jgi:hypothetical protein